MNFLDGDDVLSLFNPAKRNTAKLRHIRYIACDLDGTLLTSENRISQATVETAKELQASGIEPILVSGRSDGFIRQFAKAMRLTTPVISLNGLLMLDEGMRTLDASPIPRKIGDIVHELSANDPQTTFSVFTPSGIYSQTVPPRVPRYLRAFPEEQKHADQIDAHFESAVMYVVQGHYATVQNISVRIAKDFGSRVERLFYQSQQRQDLYYLEIKLRGITKASGLRAFCRHFKVTPKSIAAIGDYANDIEMCDFAGVSAAVRNAMSDLKDRVDFVTRATNDEDGAAEFFRLVLSARNGKPA
jgi:Cof subfamily protein (haloacid dehalogenase superfamily)